MKWRILQIVARALAALAAFSIFLLLPTAVAHADNCGSLADCFPTTDAATMVTVAVAVLIAVGVLALPHLLENPLPPGDALPPAPPAPPAPELPHMPSLPGAQPSVGSALPHAPQFPGGQVAQHRAGAELSHAPHVQGGEAAQHRAGPELPREQQVQSGQIAQHRAGAQVQRIHQSQPGEQHRVEPEHHGEHHHSGELEQPSTQPLSHENAARPAVHHGQIPEHEQAHHGEQHQEETLRHEEPRQHEQPHHHHEHHKHKIEHEHDEPGEHEEATIPLRGPHPLPELAGHRPEALQMAGEARDHRVEPGIPSEAWAHQVHPAQQEVPHIPGMGPEAPVETLLGLHHITALASDPQRNIDFYSGLLGLRLVKITVNSDAPNTYQLYYGDIWGQPGSVLSFVCKPNAAPGTRGTGQVASVTFAVAEGALQFWAGYLAQRGITVGAPSQRFGAQVLSFFDPDGLQIDLVAQREAEGRGAWPHSLIPPAYVLRGLHSTSIAVAQYEQIDRLLTEVLGFRLEGEAGNRRRYQLPGVATGAALDVVYLPTVPGGSAGVGIVQHVSWRTPNAASQLAWSYKLEQLGMRVSQITDHVYFRSLYFYEPAGVLFDIATDQPGFVVDERVEELGTHLLLPPRFEVQRAQLQQALPPLRLPGNR